MKFETENLLILSFKRIKRRQNHKIATELREFVGHRKKTDTFIYNIYFNLQFFSLLRITLRFKFFNSLENLRQRLQLQIHRKLKKKTSKICGPSPSNRPFERKNIEKQEEFFQMKKKYEK